MPKDYNVFQMLIAAICCFYHRKSIIRVKVGALFNSTKYTVCLSVMLLGFVQKCLFLYDGWVQCVSVLKKVFRIYPCLRLKLKQPSVL